MPEYKYWDLGEVQAVRPSKAAMAAILLALVKCHGKIHDTHSLELKDGEWLYPTTSCAVVFRISLPVGQEARFQQLSRFMLSPAPRVGVH